MDRPQALLRRLRRLAPHLGGRLGRPRAAAGGADGDGGEDEEHGEGEAFDAWDLLRIFLFGFLIWICLVGLFFFFLDAWI